MGSMGIMGGIFTAVFQDDDAWVIFDRCRRVYLLSGSGDVRTWGTYQQAADVCAALNENEMALKHGVAPWTTYEQGSDIIRLLAYDQEERRWGPMR